MIKKNSIVTILGGSGFLGNYVAKRLVNLGVRVQLISRNATLKALDTKVAGSVGQVAVIDCDIKNTTKLEKYIKSSDYVVNLVGVLYSRGKQSFDSLHSKTPAKIAGLCAKHGVKGLVQVSALGVDKSGSEYAKTKLAGEKAVVAAYPNAVIVRPSIMFGAEDNFINMFNELSKLSPVMPLIGGGVTKFQPVYVDDVAHCIVVCLQDSGSAGKVYELGGPKQYTFKEILQYIMKVGHRHRLFVPVPFWMAKIKAFFLQFLPKPLLTPDQVESLRYDNVVRGANGLVELGIEPTPMESVVPRYIN
jgi:uncharacterized protein YbjT (DUF2867 family)